MNLSCLKCGASIDRTSIVGRPPTYCSATCRRLAEFEVRRLDRRLAAYAIELRELKYDGTRWDADDETERQKRMRAVRRWLTQDEARLQVLLGVGRNNQETPAEVSS